MADREFGEPQDPPLELGARYILEIFVNRFGRGLGGELKTTDFMMPFSLPPMTPFAFQACMERAIHRGWVEAVDGVTFRLTERGCRTLADRAVGKHSSVDGQ